MQTSDAIVWESSLEAALERGKTERKWVLLDIFNPG
jgi:hypothetical protein